MRRGGLKGCPISTRSGRLHAVWISLTRRPDELLASTTPGAAASSISAKRERFTSIHSGPLSCTNWASGPDYYSTPDVSSPY